MNVIITIITVNCIIDIFATKGYSMELSLLDFHGQRTTADFILPAHQDNITVYSCIDIYAHSCLKPFLIGRKPCSNRKTHVQIMKFTCRLNMGFGRRHWSKWRDVIYFTETKWPTLKQLRGFWCVFTLLMLFSSDFKWIRVKMQE